MSNSKLDPKSEFIEINAFKYHVQHWGDPNKPKLFLIHGWMDSSASFKFIAEDLVKDFYLIAPDLRGFGQSEHSQNPLGYYFYDYIADLHDLLLHYSPEEPVNILGHSLGANAVGIYAGTYPERVKNFVNCEGLGIQDQAAELGPERIRKWINERGSKQFKIYPDLENLSQRLRKANPRLLEKRALILAKAQSQAVQGGYQLCADPKHKMPFPYLFQLDNISVFWKKITAKTLIITAEFTEMASWMSSDMDIQAELKRRIQLFPEHVQVTQLSDCGHMFHHEKPEELATLTLNFLKS